MSTVIQSAEPKSLTFADMGDEELLTCLDSLREQRISMVEQLRSWEAGAEAEITRRLLERGARSLPHPEFDCELTDQFTPYQYDLSALEIAAQALPDEERAKIIKHIPERVEVIPAHLEPGNPRSIEALRKKYAGSKVAEILEKAMTRESLGVKLTLKRRQIAVSQ